MKTVIILLPNIILALATDFIMNNNLFTASVYKNIVAACDKENFIISPFSAGIFLALLQWGAKNSTAKEIRSVLHLPDDQDIIDLSIKTLLPSLTSDLYTLGNGNKIYFKENCAIEHDFRNSATEIYGVDLESIHFNRRVQAMRIINQWGQNQTFNKTFTLINNPKILNDKIRTILLNVIYFKGNWLEPFKLEETSKRSFYKNLEESVEIDMMHTYQSFYNYYESLELDSKFLEIPFNGDGASIHFALPNKRDGLFTLEKQIGKIFSLEYKRELVNVSLPKFKIESRADFREILKSLKVKKMFRRDADFSGIGSCKGGIVVSKFYQKAFIDINEFGVDAPTQNSSGLSEVTHSSITSVPKEFIADHPFVFFLKIKNIVVLIGRVSMPKC